MGGLPLNVNRISAFREFINQCGLMNLGFHIPRFTWTNKNPIWSCNIKECLNRGLGNAEWKIHFPTTKIHHLPRTQSDHCPILLDINPSNCRLPKHFKFEQMWLTNPSFSHLVKQSWTSSEALPSFSSSLSRFPQRLIFLTCSIIEWNKNIFGNLFQRKKPSFSQASRYLGGFIMQTNCLFIFFRTTA